MDGLKTMSNTDEVVDNNGKAVSPLDDDYSFWKSENDRYNNPLDDDYVREEYR